MDTRHLPQYTWPSLAAVCRQYMVKDDAGRYGIGKVDHRRDIMWCRPMGQPEQVPATPNLGLPGNAVIMTVTPWRIKDGTWAGSWYDDPSGVTRQMTIVDDLGWVMPDRWADVALVGSDQMGHWDYGATLGKIGGEPPVPGQAPNEMTVDQAVDFAHEVGEAVTGRGVRFAAKRGYIVGARKAGRDWLIPYEGYNQYLDDRPKRGRKPSA